MREPARPLDPTQVLPPRKQFLNDDQLEEIWNLRGLKYRIDEFHRQLLSRGLNVSVDRPMFRDAVFRIIRGFLVEGDSRLDPRSAPSPKFPKVR